MISLFNTTHSSFTQNFNSILARSQSDMQTLIPEVLATLQDIQQRGIDSLLELVRKYDNWNPCSLQDLKIDKNKAEDAYKKLDSKLKKSLQIAFERIYEFHSLTKPKGFIHYDKYDNLLGIQVFPVARAGIYIPGGKACYPSSLLMNAIPAKVAGVQEIIMTTPTPNNQISDVLLATIHLCDITECYKIGGVGAIGMLAYGIGQQEVGESLSFLYADSKKHSQSCIKDKSKLLSDTDTESFKKVDCISGPGNIFVATAKKLVFGEVNIDMIAGPSEIGIIADSSANADSVAIDMLSQAEHDEMASALLITDDSNLAREIAQKIEEKLTHLSRQHIARISIDKRSAIIITRNLQEAVCLMNKIAPAHLEINT
ncbi:histidinol dehydrogenase, partial [Helicobacter sp. MIT 14-3879]|uniref:histidinol dehydrogenase n=1 Tax=Helicobacter sp. MIT 14-3879 TaxID=2040649 RepID=UPI000E1F2B25